MATNIAFHNDAELQARVIAQVAEHERMDKIVQGAYYTEEGNACFIGCVAHGSDTSVFEKMTGFPVILTKIGENIFEGLGKDAFNGFPLRVIKAPRLGADLSLVAWKFLAIIVKDALDLADEKTRAACQPALLVVEAKSRGEFVEVYAAADAAADAADAANAAADAAADAADAAAYAAADAAADAADAANAAAYAADAANAAAYAAADAAADAADAAYAADAADRIKQADLFIRLLEEA